MLEACVHLCSTTNEDLKLDWSKKLKPRFKLRPSLSKKMICEKGTGNWDSSTQSYSKLRHPKQLLKEYLNLKPT